jgi:eukaryotic-like serine/threonine-protein kinase
MKKLIGTSLGRYEILDLLGEGGMGVVFKARDTTLRRDLAIKVMHTQFTRQQDFRDRFLQEAQAAARLDHPCIVPVYDFGQQEDLLYIVMKFVPGDNLEALLRAMRSQKQWIRLNEAIQLVIQVCQALDYAHRRGVLHRDIKPANIMIELEPREGLPYRPILTDLGLAKLAEGGLETQTGTSMGTPAYMSPEQARGLDIDNRSDVYSLGILLYELAVGQLPFQVRTITEAIRCHTQEPPPIPHTLLPELPDSLEAIILKALEKDPARRYADAASLAEALKGMSADLLDVPDRTILGESISLTTQYQQRVLQRRASLTAVFPVTDMPGQDRIQIIHPDDTTETVMIGRRPMTVGRSPDNDIVLKGDMVSREHARIMFSQGRYRVLDLKSANGTYLDKARLLEGVPEEWLPAIPLRIGNFYLRLVPGTEGRQPLPAQAEPGQPAASDTADRIGLRMENAQLTVEPGGSVGSMLTLHNRGKVLDTFHVHILGLPEGWGKEVTPVHLNDGQQKEVAITIQVPRVPQSHAGEYPLAIKVSSQADTRQEKEVRATLTVGAYGVYKSTLHPEKIKAGAKGRVTVENLGNDTEEFELVWQDRGAELVFSPEEKALSVAAGQKASVDFQARPRNRRWLGGAHSHLFAATVTSARQEKQMLSGEVVSKALLPPWLLTVMGMLLVALFFFWPDPPPPPPTRTPTPPAAATQIIPAPEIVEFSVWPTTVDLGQSVTISWQVKNAETVTIEPLGLRSTRGEEEYTPLEAGSHSLVLVARNQAEEEKRTISVVVNNLLAPLPDIISFRVNPLTIIRGDTITIRISWETENAESVSIAGVGTVEPSEKGFVDVPAPDINTTYTLLAKNASGQIHSVDLEVIVEEPAPVQFPKIISFNVAPQHIVKGEIATIRISWETQYADSVRIVGVGLVEPPENGFIDIPSPSTATAYALLAQNSRGETRSADVLVTVVEPTPVGGGTGVIAFVSKRDGDAEIYLMDVHSRHLIKLTDNTATDGGVTWSPDGNHMAFASDRDGNEEIYVMRADGSELRRLTYSERGDVDPDWSLLGDKILFESHRDGNGEIYVMDTFGNNQTNLTQNPAWEWGGTWSNDGRRIAFVSNRDGNWEIYIMDSNGSNQRRLTNHPAWDGVPAWSPDGNYIAFASERGGSRALYIISPDGTGLRYITECTLYAYPAWSPDSKRIIYTFENEGNLDLYMIELSSGVITKLVESTSFDSFAAWRP